MAVTVCVLTFGTSAASGDSCPNAAFRSGASANLPDCRAYELVTPPFKSGLLPSFPAINAFDSSHLLFTTLGAVGNPGDNPGAAGASYAASRTASGWSSTPLDPPASLAQNEGILNETQLDTSVDFSKTLFYETPASGKPIDPRFYLRQPDGAFAQIGPQVPPATVAGWTPTPHDKPATDPYSGGGASQDLSHIVFTEPPPSPGETNWLWPGDTTVRNTQERIDSLYEYIGTGHTGTGSDVPALVGVDNARNLISQCGTTLGGDPLQGRQSKSNAISADGSTIFFTSISPGAITGCTGSGPPANELFARVDNTLPDAHTVAISEPTTTGPNADCSACDISSPAEANFQGASPDGSKVFFLTSQPLLGTDSTQNLYSYDSNAPAGQKVARISAGDPAGANVQGVARISQDGSHVYFVALGVLTTDANNQGQTAQPGQNNLYVSEPDPTRPGQAKTVFITALSSSDSGDWSVNPTGPVETTPDGRFLLISSVNNLTPDASGAALQLYRYDSQTGDLIRISFGENRFNNNGNVDHNFASFPTGSTGPNLRPVGVGISDDGAYVFFQSFAALTPQAIDDPTFRFLNVYEYHNGHVYLISDGQDRQIVQGNTAVSLIGATHSGSDVFFTTADRLVAQDTDTQQDVYDARIDGGFPAPPSPALCQGDACQGALGATPSGQVPGSMTFSGPGNLASPPSSPATKPKAKPLTRAQKLTKARKACRKKKNRRKRAVCEKQAERAYGPARKASNDRRVGR